MAIFAEITSGAVTNIAVAAAAGNLPAGTWVEIDALSPQPGIGWSYSGGTFTAPSQPAETLAQQAAAMLASGLQITCTSNSALNGTYAVGSLSAQVNIAAVVALIAAGKTPASIAEWPDTSGVPHDFTATTFLELASAAAIFAQQLAVIQATNAGTLPAQPVTIA